MWVHSLTREVTPLRPPDYVDEDALVEAGEEEDIAGDHRLDSGVPESVAACRRKQ